MSSRETQQIKKLKRQLEIEKSLDRLWDVSIKMKDSKELSTIINTLFNEAIKLEFGAKASDLIIIDKDTGDFEIFISGELDENGEVLHGFYPALDHQHHKDTVEAWRRKKKLRSNQLEGRTCTSYMKKMTGSLRDHNFPDYVIEFLTSLKNVIHTDAYMKYGLFRVASVEPLNKEQEKILKRFAKVFEQTYTRFLDLKKAEEQTREAQIETALERVRATSLSMRKTSDISRVVDVYFRQLRQLNIDFIQAWINVFHLDKGYFDIWFSPLEGVHKNVTHFQMPSALFEETTIKSWRKGEPFSTLSLNSESEVDAFLKACDKVTDSDFFSRAQDAYQFDRLELLDANYKYGAVSRTTRGPATEEHKRIFQRFAKVFEQAYTRFLDLQKAEAQAREAQIEAALERVRSRSMAMHKSEEMGEVVEVVFQQMLELDLPVDHAGFILDYQEREDMHIWFASKQVKPSEITIPYFDSPHWNSFRKAKSKGEKFFSNLLDFDAKNNFYKELFKHIPPLPKKAIKNIFAQPGLVISTALQDKIGLYFENYTQTPFTEQQNDLLIRFTKVFEQAYIRFLDLQKAEAQAREAEVQLSLERVRARSMAMYSPEELSDTISVLFDQLSVLGINPVNTYLVLYDLENNRFNFRMTGKGGSRIPHEMIISFDDLPQFKPARKAWESGEPVIEVEYSGDNRKDWLKLFGPMNKQLPKEARLYAKDFPDGIFNCSGRHAFGSLGITNSRPANEEEKQLLVRFAKEFELVYNRFLDLQKAEAQAREAQIEAALERVRASSMSMHSSDELHDVLSVLFEQFYILEINPINVFLSLFSREEGTLTYRATGTAGSRTQGQQVVRLDSLDVWKQLFEKWKNDNSDDVEVVYYERDILPKLFSLLDETFSSMPPEERLRIDQFPEGGYTMQGYTPFGYIGYNHTRPPTEEEKSILTKFASEFSRVYQRFLDIQKAEAQAREAQIEAALERVRAQAMAMHRSDELQEVVAIIFEKLQELNFALDGAAFILTHLNDPDGAKLWIGDNVKKYPTYFRIPHYETDVINDFWKVRKSGTDFFARIYSIKEKNHWFEYAFKNTDLRNQPESRKNWILQQPCLTQAFASNSNSIIGIHAHHHKILTETEVDILKRFSNVFEQGYVRFMDLKKAEAQAREAQIEAAMERIRSRALSMRHSGEIMDVITELRRQIDNLGQLDLEASVVHLYNKGEPTFKSIAAVRPPGESGEIVLARVEFPVDAMDRIEYMIEMYRSEESEYTIEFSKEKAEEWQQVMVKYAPMIAERRVGFVNNRRLSSNPEYWNFADFSGGSLLLVTHSPASEDTKEVLRKAAQVFDLAYKRFLDLQRAEEQTREAQIEAALEKVRSRTMSMQHSDELPDAANSLFQEIQALGVPVWSCGYNILNEDGKSTTCWMSSEGILQKPFTLRLWGESSFKEMGDFIRSEKNILIQELDGMDLKEHYKFMKSFPDLKPTFDHLEEQGLSLPTFQVNHLCRFRYGFLLFISYEPVPDSHDMFIRFTNVFEQTYQRFLDLQKKEEQGRELVKEKTRLEATLKDLQDTQEQLIHAEKMASLGELTAGIAHEIQNPLNFVNNFSDVNSELMEELKEELKSGDLEEVNAIIQDLKDNEQKILHHGKRAEDIVRSMLQHSRGGDGEKVPTDINALCDEYLRLSYHGLRAKDKSFNADFKLELDPNLPKVKVVPQDIGRVLLNLINNAFQAVSENGNKPISERSEESKVIVKTKLLTPPRGGSKGEAKEGVRGVLITVSDNGPGIPDEIKDKIFQPFFTTKPTGQGTGLGLSMSYDIVTKGHGGILKVDENVTKGTSFTIQLPYDK